MTTQPLWQKFKELGEFDKATHDVDTQLHTISTALEKLRKILLLIDQKKAQLNTEVTQAQKDVDLVELEAQTLKDKQTKTQTSLDRVTNQKQFNALNYELAEVSEKLAAVEERVLLAWQTRESAQEKINDHVLEQKKQKATEQIAQLTEKKAVLQKRREGVEQRREEQMAQIPQEWLNTYKRMRDKVDDPVVPLERESCSVCFATVQSSDLQRLYKHALIPCAGCYRLLYHDSEA